jgi:hypothetical protein
VLALHFLGRALLGATGLRPLAIAGVPLAAMTAVYTAFLFAQAKARDLWQNPLLPPHLVVQAVQAGAALPCRSRCGSSPTRSPTAGVDRGRRPPAVHLLMVLGELTLPHPTAHARTAAHELTRAGSPTPGSSGGVLLTCWRAAPLAPVVAACSRRRWRWPGCCCSSTPTSRPASPCRSPERGTR